MGKGTTWAPIDWVKEQLAKLKGDVTTRKTKHDQFNSVMEYVNFLPTATETFFITWNPKTDFPVQTQGYWECKIYKATSDITYTRIELSLFVRGAGHYKWLGSVQSDSTIVWGEIPANNNFITDIGRFKIVVVEDTMPTTKTTVRKDIPHSAGKLFLLSANVLHQNGSWYGLVESDSNISCTFASNQYRLTINTDDGLTAYSGKPVRMLFGQFV